LQRTESRYCQSSASPGSPALPAEQGTPTCSSTSCPPKRGSIGYLVRYGQLAHNPAMHRSRVPTPLCVSPVPDANSPPGAQSTSSIRFETPTLRTRKRSTRVASPRTRTHAYRTSASRAGRSWNGPAGCRGRPSRPKLLRRGDFPEQSLTPMVKRYLSIHPAFEAGCIQRRADGDCRQSRTTAVGWRKISVLRRHP
jgi:hypothetical protein